MPEPSQPLRPAPASPRLICVTGGVASGKTTAARMLAEKLPARFFSADEAVHDLLQNDPRVRKAVLEKFPAVCREGMIHRATLGGIAFRDPGARLFLEELLHPLVYSRCDLLGEDARKNNEHLVAEIPLLFEGGEQARFPTIILVAASPETQIRRLKEQRGLDDAGAAAILATQLRVEQKIPGSDIVLWNDGTRENLELQIDRITADLQQPHHNP